jgi:thiosulfate/3-mercaptopyruvate sulfurtransferase
MIVVRRKTMNGRTAANGLLAALAALVLTITSLEVRGATPLVSGDWLGTRDGVNGMLPSADKMEVLIGNLGVDQDVHVVVVTAGESSADLASATRVYWTLKVLGHDVVSILDGGYALWRREARLVEQGWNEPGVRFFEVTHRPDLVASLSDVEAALAEGSRVALVDNRGEREFEGAARHPWVARAGALPRARSLSHERLFEAESGRFIDAARLAWLWQGVAGTSEAAITYCNTGHLGSFGWFVASELLGRQGVRLYDGSMVEWSAGPGRPMVASWRQADARGVTGATPAR